MVKQRYSHRMDYRIRLAPDADDRAPGGAVTVALCGHWDHDGPCRWPHHSAIAADQDGLHRLVVEFDASDDDLTKVKARIDGALRNGRLTGPDGRHSLWWIEGSQSGNPPCGQE